MRICLQGQIHLYYTIVRKICQASSLNPKQRNFFCDGKKYTDKKNLKNLDLLNRRFSHMVGYPKKHVLYVKFRLTTPIVIKLNCPFCARIAIRIFFRAPSSPSQK